MRSTPPFSSTPELPVDDRRRSRRRAAVLVLAAACSWLLLMAFGTAGPATAAGAPVGLATAGTYSVLGGQTVTNTGPSRLNGDLGVSPGTAITGFPPGQIGGSRHAADANALQAQSDLTIAYDDAAGRAPTGSVAGDLVGQTKVAGVYKSTGPLALSGTLTLDAQGDPSSVFIFQVASTLTTATASYVNLINGAQACNVFWQIGSSATLGTASVFRGSILALTSISVQTNALVQGRALARNGAVTLDNDTFTSAACGATVPATPTSTTVAVAPKSTTTGTTVTVTATVTGTTTPTGTVVFTSGGTVLGTAPVNSTGHARLRLPVGSVPGTKTIVATYTGSTTQLPSTSPPATLTVRSAPPAPSSTAPGGSTGAGSTGAVSTAPTASTSGPVLASTGVAHLSALLPVAAALLVFGTALTVAGHRSARRTAKHRS